MENVKNAVKIAKHKYPTSSYTVCWIFDQSSCHKAYAEDALNVKRMNVHPGGAVWVRRVQKMTLDDGTPKGMKMILE